MCKEEGHREIVFQMIMNAARKMLEEGLITRDDYLQFNTNDVPEISACFRRIILQH